MDLAIEGDRIAAIAPTGAGGSGGAAGGDVEVYDGRGKVAMAPPLRAIDIGN